MAAEFQKRKKKREYLQNFKKERIAAEFQNRENSYRIVRNQYLIYKQAVHLLTLANFYVNIGTWLITEANWKNRIQQRYKYCFFLAKTSNKLPQLDKQLEINRDLLTKINVVNV